jgi:hypothetical protein
MSHLIRIEIMLVRCAIDIVVGRVAVDEPVKEQRIEGEPPVGWGWVVLVACPFS